METDEIVKALRCEHGHLTNHGRDFMLNYTREEFFKILNESADLIESLQAQLSAKEAINQAYSATVSLLETDKAELVEQLTASHRREQAAVEAIRESLFDTGNQRPHLNRCSQCAKFITDSKQRKYKYGCTSLCGDALKVMAACGFKSCEPLIPFADEWRVPQEAVEGDSRGTE